MFATNPDKNLDGSAPSGGPWGRPAPWVITAWVWAGIVGNSLTAVWAQPPAIDPQQGEPTPTTPQTESPSLVKDPPANPAESELTQPNAQDLLAKASALAAARQTFELKYRLPAGEKLRWQVEHTATTKTHMGNDTEEMASRSQSIRCWKILNVDSQGNMTFEHSIESMEAWEKIGELAPIAYNSLTDRDPPPEYASTADKIGKTLATFTVATTGQIVNRQASFDSNNLGMGDVLIPMPNKPIGVGHKWSVPQTFTAENDDGEMQQFAARVVYELEKVIEGKAYLVFRTEVLTPLDSNKAKSQLLQQLSRGVAVFDLEKGYITQRTIEWNEKVQGFEGPDSYLSYSAKLNEVLVPEPNRSADRPLTPKR